jgi:glycosidase
LRIYEINARVHCRRFDEITDAELTALAQLGFDAVWLMGVWQISEGARKISKVVSEDFEGSPYAVPVYEFNPSLGGRDQFARFAKRAHRSGLAVIVDFVSNHMALDSPWIIDHPQFFIRSDTRARRQSIADYYLHASGEVVAFGRDPYFPPWTDTAQLDYSNPQLRAHMTDTLRWISQYADAVRCDMAMLVLRDYIRHQWFGLARDSWFNERMPGEFWDEAITSVKKLRPDFKFIAEAYWDKEPELYRLGFDLTYEKKLYDGLVARDSKLVLERLARDRDALSSSVYFIENHDEQRAATIFSHAHNLASAALILSLPGSALIHEGQIEGRHERLPVQRVKPLIEEPPDLPLREAYLRLLKTASDEVFKNGEFSLMDCKTFGTVAFLRRNQERVVAYIGQISEAWHEFSAASLDVSTLAEAIGARESLRLTNLLNSQSIVVRGSGGAFQFQPGQLGVDIETSFCLIEASTLK